MTEQLPPGWYTDAHGMSRYWDGAAWSVGDESSTPPVGTPEVASSSNRGVVVALCATVAAVVVGTAGYFVVMDQRDRSHAAQAAEAAAEHEAAEKAAVEEAAAAEQARLDEEAQAQQAAEAQEVATREAAVGQLETEMLKTATKRHDEGWYAEAILSVQCMPVDGSAIDELAESSTSFSCIAVTTENDDGSYEGYQMSGVINWSSGEMSWS